MTTRDISRTRFDEDVPPDATTCPDCAGPVRPDGVETVCADCGLVVSEHQIDHGPEWRSFDDDDEPLARTGAPLTVARHDRGLSTEVGRWTDAQGDELAGRKRQQLARLRREQTRGRFRSKAERNLAHGLGEVRRIASGLELAASGRDHACQLFRRAQNEDLLRGRSIEAVAAASVYGACRCTGRSLFLDEIADRSRVDRSRVANAYKALNESLGLPTEPLTPLQFVPRLASALECPDAVRQRARTLATRATTAGVTTGVNPAGFAAACLYEAGGEQGRCLTQAAVAAVANVSVATVRTHRDALDDIEWE